MSQDPRVSVIIPHYNQLAYLDACLASLGRQTLPHDQFEVLVVDNASPGGVGPVRALAGDRARVLEEPAKGAGPARNRGVADARGSVLAFLDADCIASERWLEEGLEGLRVHDIVGGRVDVSVGDENAMSGAEAFERVFAFDFRSYIADQGFTGSGNLFCARSVFEAVGGFRATVSEDKDWSHRATGMGYTLGYHDPAAISHPARADWPELKTKWRRVNRETFALARDKSFGRIKFLARSWLLPASIVPHAIKVLGSPKLPDLPTRLAAIVTLARLRLWRMVDAHRIAFDARTRP